MKTRTPNPSSAPPAKPAVEKRHRGAGEVRIIGGEWRRTKLPVALKPGLRPTPDRVRETLFNWLGQSLVGWRCVDPFAGTGALGFEAASRGAAHVQVCELDPALVTQLSTQVNRLKATHVHVLRTDGVACLKQLSPASVDLIFIDPPFDGGLFEPALQAAANAIKVDGFVYLEAPIAWTEEQLSTMGLSLHRHLKAGAVHAHLLRRIA
jgi:16S rRNA (guanine(966)-N(2))-methyltransferase RsmD